jgi:hypothetical protein
MRDVERDFRMIGGSSAESVRKSGARNVPVKEKVVATCVGASEFNAYAFVRPGVQECTSCNFFCSRHYYKEYICLCLTFVDNRREDLQFKLICYLTCSEPGRRAVKSSLLSRLPSTQIGSQR